MNQELLFQALNYLKEGHRVASATIVEATLKGTPRKAGAKMIVCADGSSVGTIGGGRYEKDVQKKCLKVIKTGKPITVVYDYFGQKGQSICGGQIKVFIELFEPQKHLIICGAGHIGLSLSIIARTLDLKISIIDNRKSYCTKKRFPHVDQIICSTHKQALSKIKITSSTLIMIVTQGNEYDYKCLQAVIKTDAAYIGVISSKLKKNIFFKRLKASGISIRNLNKIKIPAGIDIGAQTPSEIAVSISSEIIKIINKENIRTQKFKNRKKGKEK